MEPVKKLNSSAAVETFKRALCRLLPTRLVGRIRASRVRRRIRKFARRTVERLYCGTPLKVQIADPLAEGWYDHNWDELPEITVLRSAQLRDGAKVFDIGAHQGVVAMLLARAAGPSSSVVAVEPNSHNAAVAEENFRLNAIDQITVVRAAIADRVGVLKFNEVLNGQLDDGTESFGSVEVDAVTIDDLADRFGNPSVVFLDVEGAECLALAGAKNVLSQDADFFVEVHVGAGLEKLGGSVEGVLSKFDPDKFTLLVRAEAEPEFRPLVVPDPVMNARFFLLALSKKAAQDETGSSYAN